MEHQKVKSWCKKNDRQQATNTETASLLATISTSFVGQEIGIFDSVADLRMAAIGRGRSGRKIPLQHYIFEKGEWREKVSAPQPTCRMTLQPCPSDHEEFGHAVSSADSLHPVQEPVVADSGCQSKAVPPSSAY